VVDSCTRYCDAVPIRHKINVFKTLKYIIDIEAKRFGYYPTVLNSDRQTKFKNKKVSEYCINHLIKTRTSDPYTPQQKRLSKRFNRTILESMRTIIEDSGINRRLWHEIAQVSCLTLNHIPSNRRKKSPFELFKERNLPLNYFQPIGIKVSYLILPEKSQSKLEPKGELGILMVSMKKFNHTRF
jgi:transposase InsO family protein